MTNEPYVMTKEPYILTKEPYMMKNEPYIMTNEPYVMTTELCIIYRQTGNRDCHQPCCREPRHIVLALADILKSQRYRDVDKTGGVACVAACVAECGVKCVAEGSSVLECNGKISQKSA